VCSGTLARARICSHTLRGGFALPRLGAIHWILVCVLTLVLHRAPVLTPLRGSVSGSTLLRWTCVRSVALERTGFFALPRWGDDLPHLSAKVGAVLELCVASLSNVGGRGGALPHCLQRWERWSAHMLTPFGVLCEDPRWVLVCVLALLLERAPALTPCGIVCQNPRHHAGSLCVFCCSNSRTCSPHAGLLRSTMLGGRPLSSVSHAGGGRLPRYLPRWERFRERSFLRSHTLERVTAPICFSRFKQCHTGS
jgi:hypothetical protein